jgi:hypothetical protein
VPTTAAPEPVQRGAGSAGSDDGKPDPLAFLGEVEAFGGAMRTRLIFKGREGGVLILAPPGAGKSTLVKRSEGMLADADDIVFTVIKTPERYSQNMGEQLVGWQSEPSLALLVQAAAHMAIVKHCITAPSFPVLSGWLPPPGLWEEVHPAITVVCLPTVDWLMKRTNSEERKQKGHYVMSVEQATNIIRGFTELGRLVEAQGAGYVLPHNVVSKIFGDTSNG